MKRLKFLGMTIVALVLTLLLLREYVLYESYVAGEVPLSAPKDLPPLTAQSEVMMKISVDQAFLESTANETIPTSFVTVEPDPTNALSDDRSKVELTRGPIDFSESNGRLQVHVPITHGRINIKGKFGVKKKNKGLLGWFESLGNVNVSGTVDDVRGSLVLSLLPQLRPDWTVNPQATADLTVNKATFTVNYVGDISVRGEIEDSFKESKDKELKKFSDTLNAATELRSRVAEAWNKAFIVERPTADPVWIVVKPTGLISAPTTVDERSVNFFVGLRAETLVSVGETKPTNPVSEMPPLEVVESTSFGGWRINIPIEIDYETVSALISRELGKLSYDDNGIKVRVKNVLVFPNGSDIALRIKLVARPNWWSKVEVTVNAFATPILDSRTDTLAFSKIRFGVESDSLLVDTLTWLSYPLLKAKLEEVASIDLAEIEASAIDDVSAIATGMFAELPDNVDANLDVESIELLEFRLTEDFAYVVLSASGQVGVDLRGLSH